LPRLAALVLIVVAGRDALAFGIPIPVSQPEILRFMAGDWTEVRRLPDVDAVVLKELGSRIGGTGAMSDAGGPFNPSDVRTGEPTRRFVLAGRSGDRWFVCYERGGLGHHLVLVIFDTSGFGARPVLLARGDARWPWSRLTVADLRRALRRHRLTVDTDRVPSYF
jgi:hypothetical protein